MHTSTQPLSAAPTRRVPAHVAVAGATGYTGQALVRLLARHPAVHLGAAMASGTSGAPRPLPALARVWTGAITPLDRGALGESDLVFLALPDAAAADIAPALTAAGVRVVDLSGAFRLRDAESRARWYPDTHQIPSGVAYGLTELARDEVRGAALVANPGCYPTATQLALVPLVRAGLLAPAADIIVDAKSGVSGAGKTPSERTHFCECHGSLSAYGVFNHRHAAEIEQGIAEPSHALTFVPHLVPIDRGLLATMYTRVKPGTTEELVGDTLAAAYAEAPFVRLTGAALPEVKHVAHTNFCDIGWRVDASGRLVIVSAIDNLVKGAAGQAIQSMNLALGLEETAGLRHAAIYPC
jgi:N-acetyl-gamma-glutamyl-phosphate reductase